MAAVRAGKETKRRGRRAVVGAPAFGIRVETEGGTPLQRAFFQRVMRGLTRFAEGGDDALEAALRASTDIGTLAYVASELAGSTAVAELDRRRPCWPRGPRSSRNSWSSPEGPSG